MKTAIILLTASLCIANAEKIKDPNHLAPPPLEASDIAWMEGISFTKGILPLEEHLRIGSVSLVIEYENGERETLIGPLQIEYDNGVTRHLQSQVPKVLVAMRMVDGQYEFFLGWNRGDLRNSSKKSVSLKNVGIRMTKTFERRTEPMESGLNFEVPVGESEIFTFLRTNSKPLARVLVISEPDDTDNPVTSPVNPKNQLDD